METSLIRCAGACLRPFNYRGLWKACKLIGLLGDSRKQVMLKIAPDTYFPVYLRDTYWARLIASGFVYEPELVQILQAIKDFDYTFLDAGANHGYWSLLASSKTYGQHPCVAIEALESNYQRLLANILFNERHDQRNIETHLKAVDEFNGNRVRISGATHQGACISDAGKEVSTVSIDNLLVQKSPPYVLKLDIEGREIKALKGAARTLETHPLILFEDHGNDPSHSTTRYVLEEMQLPVFYCRERITDLSQIDRIKTNRKMGYNFYAVSEESIFRTACGP